MAEFNNELRGALFPKDKGDNPSRPDYKGECEINHVKYWIAGWVAFTPDRMRYLSLKFERKDAPRRTVAPPPIPGAPPFNDDIPF